MVCYILYALYAPHPISMNPFASVLYYIFVKETDRAQTLESAGAIAENDQYVYVLWKILKGDGKDVSHRPRAYVWSVLTFFFLDRSVLATAYSSTPYSTGVEGCGAFEGCEYQELEV